MGTSIISFWNTNTHIFLDTRHQKRQPAGEAGSLASLNEYFGNLPMPADRRSSWKKAQVGKQNGLIRGALKYQRILSAYHFFNANNCSILFNVSIMDRIVW